MNVSHECKPPSAPPPPHTQVYMYNMLSAGEKVLATLRLELFRTLLMVGLHA